MVGAENDILLILKSKNMILPIPDGKDEFGNALSEIEFVILDNTKSNILRILKDGGKFFSNLWYQMPHFF